MMDKEREFKIDKIKNSFGIEDAYLCKREVLVDALCHQIDTSTILLTELYKAFPDHSVFESADKAQTVAMEMLINEHLYK